MIYITLIFDIKSSVHTDNRKIAHMHQTTYFNLELWVVAKP
jgi:hypothetical protein